MGPNWYRITSQTTSTKNRAQNYKKTHNKQYSRKRSRKNGNKLISKTQVIGSGDDAFEVDIPLQRENIEDPVSDNSKKFSNELSIVFGNISGLNAKKRLKLKTLTKNDHLICLNETNLSSHDAMLLTQCGLGSTAVIKSLDDVTFVRGRRAPPNRKGKRSKNITVTAQPLSLNYLTTRPSQHLVMTKN